MSIAIPTSATEAAKEKIEELLDICQLYGIPMFVCIVTGDEDGKTEYYNNMYSAKAHAIDLTDDQIARHMLIAAGFKAVPKRETLDLDMGSILE